MLCVQFTDLKMLKNVVGLVTGGASGLGRATVERMVKEGGKVTLCDLSTSDGASIAKSLGDNCVFAPTDITKVSLLYLPFTFFSPNDFY